MIHHRIAIAVVFSAIGSSWTVQSFSLPARTLHRMHPIKSATSTALNAIQEATFGMGCFWKPSEALLKVPGVVDTVVGYTGRTGSTNAPNYEAVCMSRDWVEGVRVQYNDEQMSYPQLLDAFFAAQEPKPGSRQYGSYIFPHNAQQEAHASAWLQANQGRVRDSDGVPVAWTRVEPLTAFWRAENYHQQYWQKTRPRIAALVALLVVASGGLDRVTPVEFMSALHTGANALSLAMLIFVLLERRFDSKVVQL